MKNTLAKHKKYYGLMLCAVFLLVISTLFSLFLGKKYKPEFPNTGTVSPTIVPKKLFYGSNVDMSQLLPSSPYYVKDTKGEDLIDISHRLGINTLRISSVLQAFPTQTPDVIYTKAQWDTVLNKMNTYGMKAIILAETHSTNQNIYADQISDDFITLVKKYLIDSYVGWDPAVYAIDLKNEPTLSTHNLTMMKQEADMIKQKYPGMKVTVGGWKADTGTVDMQGRSVYRWNEPQDAASLSAIVDFYSPHIYGFDRAAHNPFSNLVASITGYVHALELVVNNKMILFSEFGAANGDSVSDQQTVGSSELQANTYDAMYQVLNTYPSANILGSVGYVLYSRNQFPDSWALLKNNGDYIYPAAYVLQKYSLGTSEVSVPMPYTDVPDNIVLSDTDNQATRSANVHDMVLLGISGSRGDQYTLTINPPDAAVVVQNLQYNSQYGKFYAILKVKKSGNIPMSVTQTSAAITPSVTYTTTFVVQ